MKKITIVAFLLIISGFAFGQSASSSTTVKQEVSTQRQEVNKLMMGFENGFSGMYDPYDKSERSDVFGYVFTKFQAKYMPVGFEEGFYHRKAKDGAEAWNIQFSADIGTSRADDLFEGINSCFKSWKSVNAVSEPQYSYTGELIYLTDYEYQKGNYTARIKQINSNDEDTSYLTLEMKKVNH
jgi:hypothetical protein